MRIGAIRHAVRATVVMITVALALAGCSSKDDYTRSDVDADSSQGRQVAAMIEQLPAPHEAAALDSYVTAHAAPGLTDPQQQGLRYALEQLAGSPQRKLQSIDRFGDNVYRAVVERSPAAGDVQVMLLVEVDHELKWAGAN
jgi:outer membrane murein-binding lipoprotein Lpp